MFRLSDEDYDLSMSISRKGKVNEDLRSLIVHRLRSGAKAVLRYALRDSGDFKKRWNEFGVFCEPCNKWVQMDDWAEEIECPNCGRVYLMEFAVFSELEPEDEDGLEIQTDDETGYAEDQT